MAHSQSYARPLNVLHLYWDERTAGNVITGDQSELHFNVVLWEGIMQSDWTIHSSISTKIVVIRIACLYGNDSMHAISVRNTRVV